MKQLIECVPNFSEGNDIKIINQITVEIEAVKGVKLIDVDAGSATNRTVATMVGTPAEVCEAAFRAVKKAAELIDMRKHKGAHPRFGATDVCPLIPIANISMQETIELARQLGKRIGDELGIPVYCYENAAQQPQRKNLANCRSGEYEGLCNKLSDPDWKPDFGPSAYSDQVSKTGAIAVGARNFLIAYNVNLNTTSTRWANAVAFDVRERGRVKREGNTPAGKVITDANGNALMEPGLLKSVKAIGWFIKEYGVAQISMNLTDLYATPLHKAFDTVCDRAQARGLRVTGSELVGVVPLASILEAGKYFLRKQNRSLGVSDAELIKIAVKSMGLDELYPFEPNKKIIEYIIKDEQESGGDSLINKTLLEFVNDTASELPAPGGGSISAYMGAMGAALGGMVANLSAHKRGWEHRWEEFSNWAEKAKEYQKLLLQLVDEDTSAFNDIMQAYSLPKNTEAEKQIRSHSIQVATKKATEIPLQVMQLSFNSMQIMKAMVEIGNPNSVTDAGVGSIAANASVMGAYLNVKINAKSLVDATIASSLVKEAEMLLKSAENLASEILQLTNFKIG